MFMHWLADFVLQTDEQAKSKSKDVIALTGHVWTYTLTMMAGFAILTLLFDAYHFTNSWRWVLNILAFGGITFSTHWCTDYVTSRINSKLWAKGDTHNFFVSVGFDQFIHYATIFATLYWLGIVS